MILLGRLNPYDIILNLDLITLRSLLGKLRSIDVRGTPPSYVLALSSGLLGARYL
jgi:hypothetical protein